jgi:hypothetical protein
MSFIIESISKNGIKTSLADLNRYQTPKSGDVIDFGENQGKYPFLHSQYGRIWHVEGDTVSFCCSMGSAYLFDNGNVDISGGPFSTCKKSELEETYTQHVATFWNWGNNLPGAHQGVDYQISRPVFKLNKKEEDN